jgi:hypothetical protein
MVELSVEILASSQLPCPTVLVVLTAIGVY